jgi:hypothetical protein
MTIISKSIGFAVAFIVRFPTVPLRHVSLHPVAHPA